MCVIQKFMSSHKLVLLGESGVGKSSISIRYVKDEFYEYQESTIGAAFLTKSIDIDGHEMKFEIWDTAGQDRFKTITSSYYRGAHGIIVTYDITDRDSFAKVSEWMSEVDKHSDKNISRILVGNKKDLED